MRTAYDSTTAGDIPQSAEVVKGYVDGRYRWSDADWALFPRSVKVRMAVFANTDDGQELDVEPGCSTPQQAPGWVAMRRRAGVDPTVYCNLSTWAECRREFALQGVPEPHWDIADWTGFPHLLDGSVATQWADDLMLGSHWDLSLVADYWPGVDPDPLPPDPPPPPPPPPLMPRGDQMNQLTATRPDNGTDYYNLMSDGSVVHSVRAQDGTINFVDYPVGKFLALTEAGYRTGGIAFFRGVGGDKHIWEVSYTPGGTWAQVLLK